jgi:hypothetical protein
MSPRVLVDVEVKAFCGCAETRNERESKPVYGYAVECKRVWEVLSSGLCLEKIGIGTNKTEEMLSLGKVTLGGSIRPSL